MTRYSLLVFVVGSVALAMGIVLGAGLPHHGFSRAQVFLCPVPDMGDAPDPGTRT